jgi:hypothetical protein
MTLLAGLVANVTVVGDGRCRRTRGTLRRRKENRKSEAANRETAGGGRPPGRVHESPNPLAAVYRHYSSLAFRISRTVPHLSKSGFFRSKFEGAGAISNSHCILESKAKIFVSSKSGLDRQGGRAAARTIHRHARRLYSSTSQLRRSHGSNVLRFVSTNFPLSLPLLLVVGVDRLVLIEIHKLPSKAG